MEEGMDGEVQLLTSVPVFFRINLTDPRWFAT